eukprot:5017166-Prymnesium_polylepis.1
MIYHRSNPAGLRSPSEGKNAARPENGTTAGVPSHCAFTIAGRSRQFESVRAAASRPSIHIRGVPRGSEKIMGADPGGVSRYSTPVQSASKCVCF